MAPGKAAIIMERTLSHDPCIPHMLIRLNAYLRLVAALLPRRRTTTSPQITSPRSFESAIATCYYISNYVIVRVYVTQCLLYKWKSKSIPTPSFIVPSHMHRDEHHH